jgi:phage terminase small subunit
MAYRLMDKPEVQEFIAEFQAKQDEESEISTREVRDSYRAALRTTMRDIFEPWGAGDRLRLRAADDITPEAHLAIEEMSIDRWGKIKVKLSSKAKAREDAARMQGLFKQDNEQGADALAKALKALDEHTGLLPTDEDRKAWGEGEE